MFQHARKEEQMLQKKKKKKREQPQAPITDAWKKRKSKNTSFLPGQYKHECLLIVSTA